MGQLLRNRSLLIIGTAESVSGIGDWVTMMAVFAMIVFRGGGNVTESSGVFLAGLVPTLLASPVAGWLCDRLDRKGLMIGSQLLSGLAISGLIFTTRLDLIYALLALQAISYAIMMPARQAAVPDIVPPEDLTRANALLQQLSSIIKIGGPMLAGSVLAVLDPHRAIILDVISFALSAAILTRLPALPPHREPAQAAVAGEGPAVAPVARTVLTVLRDSGYLRLLFAVISLAVIVIIGLDVMSSIVIRDVLRGNEGLFGVVIGLVGLGSVGASAGLLLAKGNRNLWRNVMVGILLMACMPGALAAVIRVGGGTAGTIVVIVGCLVGGVGNGLINVQVPTLIQQLSPPEMLGRLGGVFQSVTVGGQLVGLLVTPLLVPGLLSMGDYFTLSAAALVVLVFFTALTLRRSRPVSAAS
jgi:MFS family permease